MSAFVDDPAGGRHAGLAAARSCRAFCRAVGGQAAGAPARGRARAAQPLVGGRRPGAAASGSSRSRQIKRLDELRPALHPQSGPAPAAARADRQELDAGAICAWPRSASPSTVIAAADVQGRCRCLLALPVGLLVGVGLPHFVVGKLIKRRITKFTANFPDAIELMVRGLRSGLPISETIGIVADEMPGPVGDRVPHGRRQDEDRPDDGRGAAGDRRPARHARIPVLRHHAWRSSARPAATSPRRCRTSPTCCASARR